MDVAKIRAKRIDTGDPKIVRVLVGGRASFFNALVAQPNSQDNPDGPKSYQSSIMVPKKVPTEVLQVLKQGVQDAIEIGITTKWNGIKPAQLDLPLRDGDIRAHDAPDKYSMYAGMLYMTARKQEVKGAPIVKAHGKVVDAPGIIESGDWCAWDINFYPFSNRAKGIAVGLNGVTLIQTGERFGGGPSEDSISNAAEDLYGDLLETSGSENGFDDLLGNIAPSEKKANDPLADLF